MRISRVFTDQPLSPDSRVELEERAGHYLLRVLKLRRGDPLVLFNGDGSDYAGEIEAAGRGEVTVAVSTRLPAVAESPLSVTLAQGVSRGERMDLTLQKATELGVATIQPLFTQRVEVRLRGARLEKRMSHWLAVLRSACEQCGRATVPQLAEPLDLSDWIAAGGAHPRLLLDPAGERNLSGLTLTERRLDLLVGPEGGFTEPERARLQAAGVLGVRLGPRILRTETAGPAALAVLQSMAGDF